MDHRSLLREVCSDFKEMYLEWLPRPDEHEEVALREHGSAAAADLLLLQTPASMTSGSSINLT